MLKLNKAGDTIVEVMIVLAVLGLALSISYATANRALANTRQAQETADASKLVETQIERLRSIAPQSFGSNPLTNIYAANNFCLQYAGTPPSLRIYSSSSANCTSLGRDGLNVSGGFYNLEIIRSGPNNYQVRASWPNVRGDGTDTVTMTYRVYPNGQ